MAKQIKRFGLPVLLVAIAAFTTVPDAGSQEVSPPQSTPELACALREAVGFGPGDALPALAGDGLHRAMIESAAAFADAHHGTLAPLINNYHEARRQLTHALSWGENVQEAHEQLTASAAAIIQACQGLLPGLAGDVPADFQPLVGLVQANLQLDPELRFLNLSPAQRQAILQARRQRDGVLLNARNWHNRAANEAARAAFEETLQSILIQPQRLQLAAVRQILEDRHLEMATAEAEALD